MRTKQKAKNESFKFASHHTIYLDSKLLAFLMQWYIHFLPGWSRAEIKCTVHVALSKWPINQLKLVCQSRKQALTAYCPNINNVPCTQGGRNDCIQNETVAPAYNCKCRKNLLQVNLIMEFKLFFNKRKYFITALSQLPLSEVDCPTQHCYKLIKQWLQSRVQQYQIHQ